jgi:hypothetical protein
LGNNGHNTDPGGQGSNRKAPKKLAERVMQLYQEKYQGFGPTLRAEKLGELEGIKESKEGSGLG